MADDALAETLGLNSSYRLGVPNPRAYDPSPLEVQYAQGMAAKLGPNGMIGFLSGAQADRQLQSLNYQEAFDRANQQQYKLGLRRADVDAYKAQVDLNKSALANPHQAPMFGPSYALIRPEMRGRADELSQAGLALTRGQAWQAQGAGTESFSDSGVAPPQGTAYDVEGRPTAPMSQGTRPDLIKAQMEASSRVAAAAHGAAGLKFQNIAGGANAFDDIASQRQTAINNEIRSAYTMAGATYGADGLMLTPPKLSTDERGKIEASATARADRIAQQRYESMAGMYGRGGFGHMVPPNPYTLAPGAPQPTPAPGVQPAPGDNNNRQVPPQTGGGAQARAGSPEQQQPAPGVATGAGSRAPTAQENAPRATPAPNALQTVTENTRRELAANGGQQADADRIIRSRPPGTKRFDLNPDGTVTYRRADGTVIPSDVRFR